MQVIQPHHKRRNLSAVNLNAHRIINDQNAADRLPVGAFSPKWKVIKNKECAQRYHSQAQLSQHCQTENDDAHKSLF